MYLRCIHIYVVSVDRRRHIEVVDEATADFEEDLNTVDQEKYDNNEKKDGIALKIELVMNIGGMWTGYQVYPVENAVKCVFVAEEFRRQNLKRDFQIKSQWPCWRDSPQLQTSCKEEG